MDLVAIKQINTSVGSIEEGQTFVASEVHAQTLMDNGEAVPAGTRLTWKKLPWVGATVVCIASGPSLTEEDCERVGRWTTAFTDSTTPPRRAIVVNTSYKRALWADVLYACDSRWWAHYHADVVKEFSGQLWTQDEASAALYHLNYVRSEVGLGLNKKLATINQGANSGFQAMHLAYLSGAAKVILLGYDVGEHNGEAHWHGDHPERLHSFPQYEQWIAHFDRFAKDLKGSGMEVVNASRRTALKCFPRVSLEEALG